MKPPLGYTLLICLTMGLPVQGLGLTVRVYELRFFLRYTGFHSASVLPLLGLHVLKKTHVGIAQETTTTQKERTRFQSSSLITTISLVLYVTTTSFVVVAAGCSLVVVAEGSSRRADIRSVAKEPSEVSDIPEAGSTASRADLASEHHRSSQSQHLQHPQQDLERQFERHHPG